MGESCPTRLAQAIGWDVPVSALLPRHVTGIRLAGPPKARATMRRIMPRPSIASLTLGCLIAPTAIAQDEPPTPTGKPPLYVAPPSDEAREQMRTFALAPGLEVELVAAEPDLCNVVAFQVDDRGRIWVVETFRINDGVFDTRNYMQWKDEDLACLTVEDRLAMYRRHIAGEIPGYAAFPERIRLLTDANGDGVVDRSTVFSDSFRELADGIASGVLVHGEDVWFANIPRLWRLRDRDGDGVADEHTAVHDGYGVHVSLIGHDLHGLVVGPDRRLYFSIGDRGFHVVTPDGRTLAYPHEGAVLRCELDGTGLEVFHRGLRNPQELAFDDRGDLFTGDNNSDGGDQARFVFVAEGGDSGWCIGHQWLDDRGRWNRERLWHPPFPGQAAWIVPPIANVADGPSGLVYDTGLGLPDRYRDHFFLCDFRGAAGPSGVHAIQLAPKGAGFEIARRERPLWHVLCTDVDIGPDGSLYVSDWVHGWNKTGKGRIYRVRTPESRNDLRLRALAQNLAADLGRLTEAQLQGLLAHDDRRLRQKAQFALIDRDARDVLAVAAKGPDQRRARLHGIWGLGVLGRRDPTALTRVVPLLQDGDAEVRAQAARVLGDARWHGADDLHARTRDGLIRAVREDVNSRVRFQAAIALGRVGKASAAAATAALLTAVRHCGDRDPWLRHALTLGLAGLDDRAALHAAVQDHDAAVRMGVLLALRHLADPAIASLLRDPDPLVRTEAARAIHDAPIDAAMPALAALIDGELPADGPLGERVLHANRLLGRPEHGLALLAFASDPGRSPALRATALQYLAEWPAPHGQDRIHGNWRPTTHPDAQRVVAAVARALPAMLQDPAAGVATAAARAAADLRCGAAAGDLAAVAADRQRPAAVRQAALDALDSLDAAELDRVVDTMEADAPGRLREAAVRIFARRNPAKAVPVLATLLDNGNRREQRGALTALGDLPGPAAAELLCQTLDRLATGDLDPAVQLELLESAARREEPAVRQRLARREAAFPAGDVLAPHRASLHGGDAGAGRQVFFQDERANCQRCHSVGGRGGNAGPPLDGIGGRVDRDYLLQALIDPSAHIADGYATVVLHLHNGDLVAGMVVKDQDGTVEVMDPDGKITSIRTDRIARRAGSENSAMPPMGGVLSARQLRDVIEFLARLRD